MMSLRCYLCLEEVDSPYQLYEVETGTFGRQRVCIECADALDAFERDLEEEDDDA